MIVGTFRETKLPPKNKFYNKLSMKGISDQDYELAQKIWNRMTSQFEIVTLGDYKCVYLATDVLLLAFEIFRNTFLNHYKSDPALFYAALGSSW